MATATRLRSYDGPALLAGGFRPFFLLAGLWSAGAMLLWLASFAHGVELPTRLDPVSWHAHEMIFGLGSAAMAGFLLTAVPNWTGGLPVCGRPLAALAGLWVAGRVAVLTGALLPGWVSVAVDVAFLAALALVLGREVVQGRNRRNYAVIGLVLLMALGNLGFHLSGPGAFAGTGARTGVSVLVMLISLIGGRIVPSFTRNWLAQRGSGPFPAPEGRLDHAALAVTGLALLAWVAWPDARLSGVALLGAALAQAARLARWQGLCSLPEPLLAVLHVAFAFVPLGLAALGLAALGRVPSQAGVHLLLAGAVGLMVLAVMTRVSLGHTGRPLHAGGGTVAVYVLALAAVLARLWAALGGPEMALHLAGMLWAASFLLFVALYAGVLTRPRLAAKKAKSRER